MKLSFYIFTTLISVSVFGQNVTQINGQVNTGQCAEVRRDNNLHLFGINDFSKFTDSFTISSAIIEDDCLVIEVVFGGGCGTTNFALITDGMVTESMHPEVRFLLSLLDNDRCKALVYRTLKFDLTKFNGYKTENGMSFRIMNSDFVVEWPE